MSVRVWGTEIRIRFSFFLVLSLFLLWDKTGWAGIGLVCILLHELAHLALMLLLGFQIKSLTLCPFGINIEKSPSLSNGYRREAMVYFAGPLCNFLLAGGATLLGYPVFSAVNLAIGLLQMVPILPLDGGQILCCLTGELLSPEKAGRIGKFVSLLVLTPLTVAALLLWRRTGNFTLLVLLFALLFQKESYLHV